MPLSKEIGWAIIDYINKARPKCNNEFLFAKMKYPFEKMEQFTDFNKLHHIHLDIHERFIY